MILSGTYIHSKLVFHDLAFREDPFLENLEMHFKSLYGVTIEYQLSPVSEAESKYIGLRGMMEVNKA